MLRTKRTMLTRRNKGQPEMEKCVFPWGQDNGRKSSNWGHLPICYFNLYTSQLHKHSLSFAHIRVILKFQIPYKTGDHVQKFPSYTMQLCTVLLRHTLGCFSDAGASMLGITITLGREHRFYYLGSGFEASTTNCQL